MAITKLGTSFLNSLFSKTKTVASKVNELIDFANNGIISALTSTGNITFNNAVVRKGSASAINATASATAAQVAGGIITSTSAAPTTITLPTATQLGTALGAVKGTVFEFVVDNSAGANTVTIAVGAGIVASGFPGTNTLTLGASTTIGIATFRLTFISATAATLARIS